MLTVEKISIGQIILMFVIGVGIHIILGSTYNKYKKLSENDITSKIVETRDLLKKMFRWWPAVYVLIIVVIFYFF